VKFRYLAFVLLFFASAPAGNSSAGLRASSFIRTSSAMTVGPTENLNDRHSPILMGQQLRMARIRTHRERATTKMPPASSVLRAGSGTLAAARSIIEPYARESSDGYCAIWARQSFETLVAT